LPSWRDAQRRRRRLTFRGRLTLALGLGGLAVLGGALSAWLSDPPPRPREGAAIRDAGGRLGDGTRLGDEERPARVARAEVRSQTQTQTQTQAEAEPKGDAASQAEEGPGSTSRSAAGATTTPSAGAPEPSAAPEAATGPPLPGLVPDLVDTLVPAGGGVQIASTLHPELTRRVERVLERARVALGHVVVLDPATGRILAFVSTDPARFPPTRVYPAASLIKIVTAAAALHRDPGVAERPCRYQGSPWRLTRGRLEPPAVGREASLRRALATSNNQCFARLAVHTLGPGPMLDAIARFGLLEAPAPGYAPGYADPGDDAYDLGKLGSGLDGTRITPLHGAQLAATLADGILREPYWIERIETEEGSVLPGPPPRPPRRVLTPELAARLRDMLVDTTTRGTARSAFRDRRGRRLLGEIAVAGKTGSLSGRDPDGRYEWFAGLAPAEEPRVAVAVLLVQGDLWWRNASQIAADTLREIFCEKGRCEPLRADRWMDPAPTVASGPQSGG